MTAIDELCQLLDERNEEYDIRDNSGGMPSYVMVGWFFNVADRAYFYGYPDGNTKLVTYRYVYNLTPEQAIAATLGPGTCHVKAAKKIGDLFGFSLSCGHSMVNPFDDHPDYCPWCGAKVVDA